jgi:GNAT superfamily N-acetyltransferase
MEAGSIIRLEVDTALTPFDCDNSELNGFLFEDAKTHLNERIAVTYLYMDKGKIMAYWCYLNDKVTVGDIGNDDAFFKRIGMLFGKEIKTKEYKSFPAVKIGRLAVSKEYNGKGLGSDILRFTKQLFVYRNRTGCRFITVDAFADSVGFYEKNDFKFMSGKDRKGKTRQMYYDLNSII